MIDNNSFFLPPPSLSLFLYLSVSRNLKVELKR